MRQRWGSLLTHFSDHGKEFGNITKEVYSKLAKEFATETGPGIQEKIVGNFYVKYDQATERVLITNIKEREIRTFYKADGRDADAFEAAIELAEKKLGKK